ncbi:MAG: hypothetical protein AABY30_03405, partial [Candidatus Thermoplasmatota archaeon]
MLTWANGDITTADLPSQWPARPWRYHGEPWIDTWRQDLSIASTRAKWTGRVSLRVDVSDASLGFTISLDSDLVARLSFTYEVLPWWLDASHLDPTPGASVFLCEKAAVDRLVKLTYPDDDERDGGNRDAGDGDGDPGPAPMGEDHDDDDQDGCGSEDDEGRARDDDGDGDGASGGMEVPEGDHDDDDEEDEGLPTVGCRLTPELWTDAERALLDAECDAIANLLVKADEGLARIALAEAKAMRVSDPDNQARYEREIGRAEDALADAYEEWGGFEYGDAIRAFLRTWEHAQKALRSTETGLAGLEDLKSSPSEDELKKNLTVPNASRILYIKEAIKMGMGIKEIYKMRRIDPWFLDNIRQIVELEK